MKNYKTIFKMQGTEKENKHDESGSNDEINECKK